MIISNNPETILLDRIQTCNLCSGKLPYPPKPILQFSKTAQIVVIGQAPGSAAHHSSKPWNDKSGDRLRAWLDISETDFYNAEKTALIPMGFCYPGRGKSGDLPPRKECAPQWHNELFSSLQKPRIKLLVGKYAQDYYLKDNHPLVHRCKNWQNYKQHYLVLPHPSPRNNIWLKKNPWFEAEVIPEYKALVSEAISSH